jgi:hypothetical protein
MKAKPIYSWLLALCLTVAGTAAHAQAAVPPLYEPTIGQEG